MSPPDPKPYQNGAWLFGTILLTASVSGYFMGLRQTSSQISMTRPVSLVTADSERGAVLETNSVPVAVSYAGQDWLRDGANGHWENHLANLAQPSSNPVALTNATETERALALAGRAARRAFDGAPPVVPHPIAQDSSAACLACHGPGLAVKDRIASRISHARYSSCTQCHVPSGGTGLPASEPALLEPVAANQFAGVTPPMKGTRAWPLAPPTIPHSTLMRGDCLSCHGPGGLSGLRTPHPDRQSCVQCHVSDAELDQHVFSSAVR
ncbi:MAG: nitrate reductase cytochrome c-type subunit [Verrucomicrobia bacterium]|nr:nitrate reductase cytochrome c-type subunit [Verrucomicrobiota bacterium]